MAPLKVENAELINSFWVYNNPSSINYIKAMIDSHGSLGLFDKNSNQLICWAIINEFLGIG